MKKRFVSLFLCFSILLSLFLFALPSGAASETVGGVTYEYTISSNKAVITGCSSDISGDVIIPSKLGGKAVIEIGIRAFYERDKITSLTIPSGVQKININAFYKCTSLTKVSFPNTVTEIGYCAFYGCSSLREVAIPSSVKDIENYAFSSCSSLEKITVDKNNKVYNSQGNCLIHTADRILVLGCKNSVIPADGVVTVIGNYSFLGCSDLSSIVIPHGVISIGNGAFSFCTSLKKIVISDTVKYIGLGAFQNSESISDIGFEGTKEQWENIEIEKSNDIITVSSKSYNNETKEFNDVKRGAWYTDAVLWCNEKGYITGVANKTFSPNTALTRAMFVQILVRVGNEKTNTISYEPVFTDVAKGSWYTTAVLWAYKNKITQGTSAGKFSPNDPVTRQQLATFFLAYSKYKGYDTSASTNISKYPDSSSVRKWASDAVKWAIAEGLISGVKNGTKTLISPDGLATRAQAAVIFKNYVELYMAKQK